MNMEQKTICIIRCDQLSLPILNYIDSRSFVALAMSKGVIIWVYKGLAMLIPPERIANMARVMDNAQKQTTKRIKGVDPKFTSADAIRLPSKIARALLGDE